MDNILSKNNDGSIDILDDYGHVKYTVDKDETGVIARLANKLYDYESRLKDVLMDYFDIPSDTYTYNLTRDKSAFELGTMKIEDFEEFNEEIIDDIVQYIKNWI